jgi:hypothetical protein
MQVDHLPCGAFANASEEAAFRAIDKYLRALPLEGRAFVLTNLAHGVGRGGQKAEIDVIVIVPGDAVVIEVKHWDRARLKANAGSPRSGSPNHSQGEAVAVPQGAPPSVSRITQAASVP